jgi:peptide/nickel transport system permease protein
MALITPPDLVAGSPLADGLPSASPRFAGFTSHPWTRFLLRRLISIVVILVLLSTVVFSLVRLIPGDPGAIIGGTATTRAGQKLIDHQLGLDQSLLTQYGHYWRDLFHGNLGTSFVTGDPVTKVLNQNAGPSLQLAGVALGLVLVISISSGIAMGALTRNQRHRGIETWFTGVASVIGALPELLVATLLSFAFALQLKLLPVGGTAGWRALVLPVVAISLRPIAILMRLVRVETLAVLSTDYMRTARSKRLPTRTIYIRHVLPNVVTAALTIGGLLFADLIAGTVIVENIFARHGLGTTLVNSVLSRDYPVIQGMVLVLGVAVVVANAIVDFVLAAIDPRQVSR